MKYLLLMCALLILSRASSQKPFQIDKYRIFAVNYGMSGTFNMDGSGEKFINITTYLVNNADDTLYYWGTACRQTQFFSISKNPYLYLEDKDCKKYEFTKYALPPHRSQEIGILLSEKKEPDTIIHLKIAMKLFRWNNKSLIPYDRDLIEILSDSLTLKFNKQGNSFLDKDDFDAEFQKYKLIPPDLNLYLLTDNDRRSYTLTVDQEKVSAPHDTVIENGKKVKAFNIPVSLNNKSNDTLKFLTMTCSWETDFDISNNNIQINGWDCDGNIPTMVTILPHHSFLRMVPVYFYDDSIIKGTKFKISMSLTIPHSSYWGLDLYLNQSGKFNQIWTNNILVP